MMPKNSLLSRLLGLTIFNEGPDEGGGPPAADPPADPGAAPAEPDADASTSGDDDNTDPNADWLKDDDADETPPEPDAEPAPTAQPPVAKKEPEPAAAAPAPDKPPVAAEAPVTPPAEPTTPTPAVQETPPQPAATPPKPQPTEAERQAAAEKQRADFRTSLVGLYKPEVDKVADKILEEPSEVLSGLAAELHMRVVESAVSGIMAQLPQYIGGYLQQQRDTEANETKFYQAWPQLAERKQDAAAVIGRFGAAYRQAHPGATMEDWIREVGAMTMVAMKIQPQAATPTPQAATPSTPQAATAGFSPAQPGSGGGPVGTAKPLNEWEELQQEFLQEDQA